MYTKLKWVSEIEDIILSAKDYKSAAIKVLTYCNTKQIEFNERMNQEGEGK